MSDQTITWYDPDVRCSYFVGPGASQPLYWRIDVKSTVSTRTATWSVWEPVPYDDPLTPAKLDLSTGITPIRPRYFVDLELSPRMIWRAVGDIIDHLFIGDGLGWKASGAHRLSGIVTSEQLASGRVLELTPDAHHVMRWTPLTPVEW